MSRDDRQLAGFVLCKWSLANSTGTASFWPLTCSHRVSDLHKSFLSKSARKYNKAWKWPRSHCRSSSYMACLHFLSSPPLSPLSSIKTMIQPSRTGNAMMRSPIAGAFIRWNQAGLRDSTCSSEQHFTTIMSPYFHPLTSSLYFHHYVDVPAAHYIYTTLNAGDHPLNKDHVTIIGLLGPLNMPLMTQLLTKILTVQWGTYIPCKRQHFVHNKCICLSYL